MLKREERKYLGKEEKAKKEKGYAREYECVEHDP